MVFQTGADDLLAVVQRLRADTAHHRISQERLELTHDCISPALAVC